MKVKSIFIMLISIVLLTSCDVTTHPRVKQIQNMFSSEDSLSEGIFNNILVAIEERNIGEIRILLAQDANEEITDEEIQNLFDFFEGEIVSTNHVSGSSKESVHDGGKVTKVSETWLVETDVETYLLSFEWYRYNYETPKSIGLQIIEANYEGREVQKYAMDSDIEIGIFIAESPVDLTTKDGVQSEYLARKIIELMDNDDIVGLKNLLSVSTLYHYKEFDKTVSNKNYTLDGELKGLVHYYEGELISLEHNSRGLENQVEDQSSTNRVRDYWNVETTEGSYILFISECRDDKLNNDNVGVYQIGISEKSINGYYNKSWEERPSLEGYDKVGIYLPSPNLDDKVYKY